MSDLADIQNFNSTIPIAINQVGIRHLKYPIKILDRIKENQTTVSDISMYVSLNAANKATHMSRFVEVFGKYAENINFITIEEFLQELKQRLAADAAYINLEFKYFIQKKAPVSRKEGLMDYDCSFNAALKDSNYLFNLKIAVPVITLCPCSKAISKYGAHNQKAIISINVRFKELVWIEEMVELCEGSASSPVFSLLKREDEKYVTEKAFENPVFVEDVVRKVAEQLKNNSKITWFEVSVEAMESIHNHSAYARIVSE